MEKGGKKRGRKRRGMHGQGTLEGEGRGGGGGGRQSPRSIRCCPGSVKLRPWAWVPPTASCALQTRRCVHAGRPSRACVGEQKKSRSSKRERGRRDISIPPLNYRNSTTRATTLPILTWQVSSRQVSEGVPSVAKNGASLKQISVALNCSL